MAVVYVANPDLNVAREVGWIESSKGRETLHHRWDGAGRYRVAGDVSPPPHPSKQWTVLDPATCTTTLVGVLGVNIGVSGMASNWSNDILYLTEVSSDSLYFVDGSPLVDPTTGVSNPGTRACLPEPSTTSRPAS